MKLIVGLGNPEKRYDGTRHNVGFAILDAYAAEQGVTWKESAKFKSYLADHSSGSHPELSALLMKPTTYYNLSGEAVRVVADFYKIQPEDILIIHDDHALPFGTLRTRTGGSDAGNNGVKSINAHMPETNRLRVGTHSELRGQIGDTDYVLSKFSQGERALLSGLQQHCNSIMENFLAGNFIATTYQLPSQEHKDER